MKCARCATRPRHLTYSYCKECKAEYQREWQRANPQRQKRYRDNWQRRVEAGEHVPGQSGPGKVGRPRSEQ